MLDHHCRHVRITPRSFQRCNTSTVKKAINQLISTPILGPKMAANAAAGRGALMILILMPLIALTLLHQVVAQSPTLLPVTCSLSNASMISPEYCTYYDQQNMASQTGGCQSFLTNIDTSPSADCCAGLNKVAYYRTACVCLTTFYPPSNINMTRNLELPMLCGVTTDLCTRCPTFLVARTADSAPIG